MDKNIALRLALEALKWSKPHADAELTYQEAITAIKAALEAKDEPWEKFCDSNCVWTDHHPDCKLAQPEQDGKCKHCTDGCPACDARKLPEQELVQVSPLEFVEMVMEKEHLVGKPIFWAEWPNKENT